MIKFFRQIRYKLMETGKTGKYFKYAIGEIILVVIGILIALQINNLNEKRKETKLSQEYLIGINNDLKKDIKNVDRILKDKILSIRLIYSIDDVFKNEYHRPEKYPNFFGKLDTTQIVVLFHRGVSFRSIKGSYNSLISDGKSGSIQNRELFLEIQEIYDELIQRITSTYEGLKVMESKILWAYPYQKKHWTYADLKNAKEDKIFLDLSNFTEQKYFYAQDLYDLKERMLKVVELLEKELEKK